LPEIKFSIPENLPARVLRFELEKELNLKIKRLERIKEAISSLGLTRKDIEKFEHARQKAWEKTKHTL
jgi:hypothetical protein